MSSVQIEEVSRIHYVLAPILQAVLCMNPYQLLFSINWVPSLPSPFNYLSFSVPLYCGQKRWMASMQEIEESEAKDEYSACHASLTASNA